MALPRLSFELFEVVRLKVGEWEGLALPSARGPVLTERRVAPAPHDLVLPVARVSLAPRDPAPLACRIVARAVFRPPCEPRRLPAARYSCRQLLSLKKKLIKLSAVF